MKSLAKKILTQIFNSSGQFLILLLYSCQRIYRYNKDDFRFNF